MNDDLASLQLTGNGDIREEEGHPVGQFTVLEPRIVFDAAVAPTATETTQANKTTTTDGGGADTQDPMATDGAKVTSETQPDSISALITRDAPGTTPDAPHGQRLLFVDARLATLELLSSAQAAGVEVSVINADRDGMAQVREALVGRTGLEEVQILAQSQDHYLQIGSSWVSASNLQAFSADLTQVGGALTADGKLVVYEAGSTAANDGSLAIHEAVSLSHTELASYPQPDESGFIGLASGVAVDATTAARTAEAEAAAVGSIANYLNQHGTTEDLFALFSGGQTQLSAEWNAAARAFLDAYRSGSADVRIEYRSNDDLYGAYAAFAGRGADGRPLIYLNADFAKVATAQELTAALIEEYGHFIDWSINGERDTQGDEGERFAAAVTNEQLSDFELQRITAEDDRLNVMIDGSMVEVEMASLMFTKVFTTGGSYTMEFNQPVIGGLWNPDPGNPATRYLFQSTNPLDVWFSGNNVQGKIYAIDASNNVRGVYFGEVSRLVKTGSTLTGLQFYAYPGGVVGNGLTASTTLLIEVPQGTTTLLGTQYATGSVVGTSSDPVSTAMNALIPGNAAPAPLADTGDAYMPHTSSTGTTPEATAVGNVLSNDSDPNLNYSINTTPEPDQLVTTQDTLRGCL